MFRIFNRKKSRPRLSRTLSSEPPRRGKKKLSMNSKGSSKRISDLRKKGFVKASRRPINTLTDSERDKIEKKVENKDIEIVYEPPIWQGEQPREWLLYRRKQ